MLKNTLIVVVVLGLAIWDSAQLNWQGMFAAKSTGGGVRLGASVAEVEKILGPARAVSPAFGREERTYKAASGTKYLLIFEDGKLVEIH